MKGMLVVCIVAALSVSAAGCAKKKVAPEEVGKSLAALLCEKHASCQPNPDFKKDQCLQEIGSGLTERLKGKKDFRVDVTMLENCKKSIVNAKCEILSSESPPAGCEFLQ